MPSAVLLASFAAAGVLVLGVDEVEAFLREPERVAEFEVLPYGPQG